MPHRASGPRAGLRQSIVSLEGHSQGPRRGGGSLTSRCPLVFDPTLELETAGEVEARHKVTAVELQCTRETALLHRRREFHGVAATVSGPRQFRRRRAPKYMRAERRPQLMQRLAKGSPGMRLIQVRPEQADDPVATLKPRRGDIARNARSASVLDCARIAAPAAGAPRSSNPPAGKARSAGRSRLCSLRPRRRTVRERPGKQAVHEWPVFSIRDAGATPASPNFHRRTPCFPHDFLPHSRLPAFSPPPAAMNDGSQSITVGQPHHPEMPQIITISGSVHLTGTRLNPVVLSTSEGWRSPSPEQNAAARLGRERRCRGSRRLWGWGRRVPGRRLPG